MATVNFIRYEKQSAGALIGVKQYVEQKQKTYDGEMQLVSGQNCSPQLADREFIATRNMHRKQSPIWFYHYTQSFHPQEPVTGQTAHEIAKEFAARAWPDSEVLIATHIDAEHIHSHFIVNAVCHESGRMLRQGPSTLARLRKISDEICQAHQLSVLPPNSKGQRKGMSAREYRSAAKGQSWKFKLMSAIDECTRYAKTREEFLALMRSEGYDVRWTDARKNITYTTPDGLKCRDDRLHDGRYLKEAMEREFRIRQAVIAGGVEATESPGTTADPASDDGGMGRSATSAGHSDPPHRGAGNGAVGADGAVGDVPQQDADRGAGAGCGGAAGDVPTGWEEERAAAFSAAPRHAPGAAQADPGVAVGHSGSDGDSGGLVRSLVRLGRSAERAGDTPPITDSTTRHSHTDSKALKKERQKKIAQGHAVDDHEEQQQTWQQTI